MRLINLTPHVVTFVIADGRKLDVPTSGLIARVSATADVIGDVDGIPVTVTRYGDVVDLPDPAPDTAYIVSTLVANAVPDRADVFIPADPVRDDAGRIIGAKALGRITA